MERIQRRQGATPRAGGGTAPWRVQCNAVVGWRSGRGGAMLRESRSPVPRGCVGTVSVGEQRPVETGSGRYSWGAARGPFVFLLISLPVGMVRAFVAGQGPSGSLRVRGLLCPDRYDAGLAGCSVGDGGLKPAELQFGPSAVRLLFRCHGDSILGKCECLLHISFYSEQWFLLQPLHSLLCSRTFLRGRML